jgi:hypothetical protein
MNHIIRRSTLAVLLTCFLTQDLRAQDEDAASDTVSTPRSEDRVGGSNYWIPALEIPVFLGFLNGAARVLYPNEMQDGKRVYDSTWETTRDHLKMQDWVNDQDPFNVNQFSHPYLGATMFNFPRSTGVGFWPSLIYANAGSFMWEMAGETTPPSINDIITTGQAGSLLGEAMYRIAATVWRDRPDGKSQPWHRLLADLIDPARGVNSHVLGDGYRTRLSEVSPALSWQLRLGATKDVLAHDYNDASRRLQQDATVEYSMTYGIPGKPDYDFSQPFSYFDFRVSALFNRTNPIESVMLRGLLLATQSSSRKISGIFGSYDYIAPHLFRVSSTALSFGTMRADWIASAVAIQTSVLGGVGYGAGGTSAGMRSTPTSEALRDYHYGVTPQALAALRIVMMDRIMLDGTARGYYVSGLGSDDTHGSEALFRGDAGVIVRLIGGQSIGARFTASKRVAHYGTLPDRKFHEQTWTVAYSFVGNGRFSGGKWQ